MRRLAMLFFFTGIIFPVFAAAQTLEKAGFKGADDICLSETIELKDGKPKVSSNANAAPHLLCKEKNPDNKCQSGEAPHGTVSFKSITDKTCEVNKCDKDFKDKLSKCMKGTGITSSDPVDLSDPAATRTRLETTDVYSDSGQQTLLETLHNAGVDSVTSEQIKDNPEAAADLIQKIADRDSGGAQAAAQKLGLNDDLKNVARLDPNNEDALPANAKSAAYNKGDDVSVGEKPKGNDTFGEPQNGVVTTGDSGDDAMNRAKRAIASIESGGRYYITGPCTNGDCPYGKYQIMGKNVWAWSCEMGQCMSPQQFLASPEAQERLFEYKFGQYMQRYGPEGAARAWFAGPGGMWGNSRDILGTSVSNYAAKFNCAFSGQCNTQLAANPYTGNGYQSPVANTFGNNTASPVGFAPRAPVSSAGPVASAYSQPQIAPQPALPPQPQLPPQPVTSPGSAPGNAIATPVPAVASIIVQPSEVVRGKPLIVSWTSAGVSTATPCTLHMREGSNETLLETKNAGSRSVATDADSPTGTWTFVFKCTPVISGSPIEKQVSATVK